MSEMPANDADVVKDDDATAAPDEENEDLEDGEIDDDSNDASDVIIVGATNSTDQQRCHESPTKTTDSVVTIDLSNDNAPTPPPPHPQSMSTTATTTAPTAPMMMGGKSKKPQPVEDDHASSIENAIASALKKKGIEPTLPKIRSQQQPQQPDNDSCAASQGQSRSSRRRKRKKQRDEKEREKKERKEKRKRFDSPDPTGPPPLEDEEDMDDYEMLNVRGGSPPPMTAMPPSASASAMHGYKDQHESGEESAGSSYDSYDSMGEGGGGGGIGGMGGDGGGGGGADMRRRRRRNKKDSRKRRERRNRDDERRQEKRNRRDSLDEKHRQEPRKLELCKFYLMECCAKKDKCSYMHADFPCKYYYLGMDCVYKEACKFSHGEPLSEQLRNILLKHLETAPKEILGNFKRISRENAISLMTKQHEELCKQFGVANVWSPMSASSIGGAIHNNRRNEQQQQQQQAQQQQQLQLQQQQQTQNQSNIPSLLDIVINPPNMGNMKNINNNDKQRKSRWTDTPGASNTNSTAISNNSNSSSGGGGVSSSSSNSNRFTVEPPSSTAPSYLDLKNLTRILSNEHIEKLSQLGIVNLEQVNQLTFGQLNQIGLTIAEISEIQLNAMNMAKLGVPTSTASASSGRTDDSDRTQQAPTEPSSSSSTEKGSEDVIASSSSSSVPNNSTNKETADNVPEKDMTMGSNSNSNSSSGAGGVVMVDYSQYLKDSNLSFDRGDIYDDEKDEEQLVIDDGNLDHEDHVQTNTTTTTTAAPVSSSYENESKKPESCDSNSFATKLQQMGDMAKALHNPFSSSGIYGGEDVSGKTDSRDPRGGNTQKNRNNPFRTYPNEDTISGGDDLEADQHYLSMAQLRSRRDSRSRSRSRSRTPTRSQSNTPEASQSPPPLEAIAGGESTLKETSYERSTMYDYNARYAEEDEARAAKSSKADKDMRYLPGSGSDGIGDIDLRLPFQPMTSYTPATEIDGSITSHLPMTYKVYEIEVPRPSFLELRQHFKSDHTTDPRLRRIFGLPELSQTKTSAALTRAVRKLSNNIASPESEDASPRYYTPPASFQSSGALPEERSKQIKSSSSTTSTTTSTVSQLRLDPRRAAAQASNTGSNSGSSSAATTTTTTVQSNSTSSIASGGQKQNVEIRNLLQKSEWYKNLNSKFKIMVNQQLALVSTELKKFHLDTSPNKIFDISFIVNNSTLQQILTNLGIYIDDNGEVAHVDGDTDEEQQQQQQQQQRPQQPDSGGSGNNGITLPNLSQPPPNTNLGGAGGGGGSAAGAGAGGPTLDFLRAPPPNMVANAPPPIGVGPMFRGPPMHVPPFARPSLLGLPPGAQGNPFNPFAASAMADLVNMNPNFLASGGPGMLGPAFGSFGPGAMPHNMQQQRNFGGSQQRRNRRNNKI